MSVSPRCWGPGARWGALLGASAVLTTVLERAGLPAGLLMGPMLAAVALAGLDAGSRLPPLLVGGAQAVVGGMIATTVPPSLLHEIGRRWPVFGGGVVAVILAAALLGFVLARLRVLDGSTAVWGTMPGAATVMTLMSERSGADMRIVAFMQYSRVLCVVMATTLVAALLGAHGSGGAGAGAGAGRHWLAVPAPGPLAETIGLVGIAAAVGVRFRLPAGALIAPMVAGIAWKDGFGLPIALPPALLAAGYAVVGWSIGLRFTRTALRQALRALPRVLLSIVLLIAVCAALGWGVHEAAGVSALTGYLATSPGGADSVAIIAGTTPVDVPFVMAMQVGRFLLMLAVGPVLARGVARLVE